MLYQGLEALQHVCFYVGDSDGTLETPCGVTVSPVAPCEVIVYGPDGCRVVYDAAYGSLPNSTLVVAVRDSDGVFPSDDGEITLKVVFDKYGEDDPPHVVKGSFKPVDPAACPVCGDHTEGQDDDDDDDPGPEPAPENSPTNRIKDYLPSTN